MTNEELAEIKARVEAATPPPWYICRKDPTEIQRCPPDVCGFEKGGMIADICIQYEDADFIAHARTDIPALVAEVERLRAALEQIADGDNWTHGFDERGNPVLLWDDWQSLDPRDMARQALEGKAQL